MGLEREGPLRNPKGKERDKCGSAKHLRSEKFISNKGRHVHAPELRVWRDEVLKRCSGNQHPSSSPIVGAGRAWVSAPPVPWCLALVVTRVVCHQNLGELYELSLFE